MERRLSSAITFCVLILLCAVPAEAEILSTPAGDLAYETRGEGCPLVLVGGGSAMDARQWQAARDLLAERFLTISIDPRSVGRSANPRAPYADADDLVAVLDHLGLPAAIFAGGSAAGATVLEVALAHPERVIGAVAVAPFLAGFEPSPEMADRMGRFGAAVQAGGAAFVELVRDDPHFLPAPERPEAREAAWQLIRETFARPAADPSLAREPDPPVLSRLDEIVPPLLLVVGELDHPDIFRRLDTIEAALPSAQRVTVPAAGHTVAMENPQGFVDATLPFLHGLGCSPFSPERAAARAELLHLHAEAIRFHLENDVDGWLEGERPVQIVASRGELVFPTAAQRRSMREGYLGATEFSVYRDLVPPVVRLAYDLSQGWLMAQVEVEGVQQTESGEESFRWVWAWVELFERDEDGDWVWVGNVSNSLPQTDREEG
ncbi:MAG: alpha/beta hydrolase [bacterium]|nr:alpha/beta hydrolase [bacterium]